MDSNQPFSNINLQPKIGRAKYISNSIKGMITSGELKIGDKLPTEESLCKHFSVSRTTLREAVQMLRARGMLEVSPGRGSFIKQIDITDLTEDLALFSRSLDTVGAETTNIIQQLLVEEINKTKKLSINQRQVLFSHVLEKHDSPEKAELKNRQWKTAIANLNGNQIVGLIVDMLLQTQITERRQRFIQQDEVMRTIQSQINLNTALIDRDTAAAKSIFTTYVNNSFQ